MLVITFVLLNLYLIISLNYDKSYMALKRYKFNLLVKGNNSKVN